MFSFLYHCEDFNRTWLYMSSTRVSYKTQELLTLPEHPSSSPFFVVGSVLLIALVFFCVFLLCVFYVLSTVLWCPLRFPRYNEVRIVLTPNCSYEDACRIYIISVCLHMVVSNTCCVGFVLFVLCTFFCPFLWIDLFRLSLWYSLTFIYFIFSPSHGGDRTTFEVMSST